MEKTENALKNVVKELFDSGKIDLLIAYERGTIPLRSRPCFVAGSEDAQKLVWDDFCSNNLAVYLPQVLQKPKTKKKDDTPLPKVGIVTKGCDAMSIAGLLKEHQIPRENLTIIGVPCQGVIDSAKVEAMSTAQRWQYINIENEAKDIKTFTLVFENKEDEESFKYLPGQFAQLSVFGKGESPIGIASSPTEKGCLRFSVKRMGKVTSELHSAEIGFKMGVRGPFGNSFPWDLMKGRNILIIGGGFAFTTLRSAIIYMLDRENRGKFEKITVMYGSRTPGEFLYRKELDAWGQNGDMDLHLTVDKADADWKGREGVVTTVIDELQPSPENTIVLVCGPPIMVRFVMVSLLTLKFPRENVMLSLEMRMKCGIGKCGRCNIGSKYVCTDGPVFPYDKLVKLPAEY